MADKKTNNPQINEPTAVAVVPPSDPEGAPSTATRLSKPLRWKSATTDERKLLRNLQGNILKGHGRDRTWNIFFEFGADSLKSKRLLRELGNFHVTDAYAQLLSTEAYKTEKKDGGTFCAVAISATGYQALGLTFQAAPGNAAFAPGMKASAGALADPPVAEWEAWFRADIDGLIIIADDEAARGSAAVAHVNGLLAKAGATVHHTQAGKAIRNTFGNGLEHFGYVDGRSQPLMLVEDIETESRDAGIAHWDPSFPLSTALVTDPLANDPEGLSFGSFFVFRKLEQNVLAFKTTEQDLADELGLDGEERERAGAFLVGRFEDGTPVTMSADAKGAKHPPNDFDYGGDAVASRCPFHGHIRKTNPRGSGRAQLEPDERLHIMARRGITYEDTPRVIHPDGLPEVETREEFLKEVAPHLPAGGVGLLFMAYNAKLDEQFVFTQTIWANNPGFPADPSGSVTQPGIDGVIGQGPGPTVPQSYPDEWDNKAAGFRTFPFQGFVTMKGGEYFFAPSVSFLRNL